MPSSQHQRHYHRDNDLTRPYPRRRYPSETHHSRDHDRRRRRSDEEYVDRYDTRRSRDDGGRSRRSPSRSRSYHDNGRRSVGIGTKSKTSQALAAAVTAGAVEAIKVRKDPGPWTGKKGVRVVSAALGAAALDAAVDKDPTEKPKRHVAEATAASLVVNHLLSRGK